MGGGGGWNPFQDVSWSRPFGNSELGNALQGNPNAPLTAGGVVKDTGEQLVADENQVDPITGQTNAAYGLPTRDPRAVAAEQQAQQMAAQSAADTAAQRKARQDESDIFTNRFTGQQGKTQMLQSLQGLQDQARRLKGRKLFNQV